MAEVYVNSWNSGFVGLTPARPPTADDEATWARQLAALPPHYWWVGEQSACVVGFVGIRPAEIASDEGEVDTIAVRPDYWRRGIGRMLMRVAVDGLKTSGYREAVLWTWAGYELGQRFYEATGWQRDGAERQVGRQVRYRHRL